MSSFSEPRLWAVVLAGGVGSRFWPVSRPGRPKQLLPLASPYPLLRDAIERLHGLVPPERLRVITGASLVEPILATVPELSRDQLWVEPRAAGTAPALLWAAAEIARCDPSAVLASFHADHAIHPAEVMRQQVRRAAELAVQHRRLFTLGAVPTRPETGYGYVVLGSRLGNDDEAYAVERFLEKPDRATAEALLRTGKVLWNTGLFVWRVEDLLAEARRHAHELPLRTLDAGDVAGFFAAAPTIAIDHAVLERSDRVGVLRCRFAWDDVGAWDALYRTRQPDPRGNVAVGEALAVDCDGCALYAEEGRLVAYGVRDLIAVRARTWTLVLARERAADLKALLAQLPPDWREGE